MLIFKDVLYFCILFFTVFISFCVFIGMSFKAKTAFDGSILRGRAVAIVPAHNEELVIINILTDLVNNKFDRIFIILDACTDKSETLVKAFLDFNNNSSFITVFYTDFHSKGKSLKKCLPDILDMLTNNDDIYFFDADNRIFPDFLNKAHNIQGALVQFHLRPSNFSFLIPRLYGLMHDYYYAIMRGFNMLGLSCALSGTATRIEAGVLKNYEYDSTSLVEDCEYSFKVPLYIHYEDSVFVYDEKPTNFWVSCNQRLRWCRGNLDIFFSRRWFTRHFYFIIFALMMFLSLLIFPFIHFSISYFLYCLMFSTVYFLFTTPRDEEHLYKFTDYIMFYFFNLSIIPICVIALVSFKTKFWYRTPHKGDILNA